MWVQHIYNGKKTSVTPPFITAKKWMYYIFYNAEFVRTYYTKLCTNRYFLGGGRAGGCLGFYNA